MVVSFRDFKMVFIFRGIYVNIVRDIDSIKLVVNDVSIYKRFFYFLVKV